eukprot:6184866-Pleurochrysis_carterae.AAC.1
MPQVKLLSFSSRVLKKALSEVVGDVLPNLAFRADGPLFERPPACAFTLACEREPPPRGVPAHALFGTRSLNAHFAMRAAAAGGTLG